MIWYLSRGVPGAKQARAYDSRVWDSSWSFQKLFVMQIDFTDGITVAVHSAMKFFCRHCDAMVLGDPYRVTSEEDGVILLDMTVCRSCYNEARALGLHSEAISLDSKPRRHRYPWVYSSTRDL